MMENFASFCTQNRLDLLNEDEINYLIKENELDTNKISDGYHTFGELYEHRIELYIALALLIKVSDDHSLQNSVWRSKAHSDGSIWDSWFILGIGKDVGQRITYHLPISYWNQTDFAETLDNAPEWDGHTSKDVLNRLKTL
jgi:hypothetical protein